MKKNGLGYVLVVKLAYVGAWASFHGGKFSRRRVDRVVQEVARYFLLKFLTPLDSGFVYYV